MAVPLDKIPTSVLLGWVELASDPVQIRGWGIVVQCAVLGTVSVAVVGTRLWLRAVVQRKFDISDWFALIALILTLGLIVLGSLTVKTYGMDHHVYNLSTPQLETLAKVYFADMFLTHWAPGFVRLSILLFYRLILRNHSSKVLITTLWIVFAIVAGLMLASFTALFLACRPLSAFWYQYNSIWTNSHTYTCDNHGAFLISTSALSAVLDIAISLMPVAVLWNLQIPMRQKIAIWMLFSLGIVSCVAAMMRIYWVVIAFYKTYDFTWAAYGIVLWTTFECSIALIGSSLPALKVIFSRFFDHKKQTPQDRRTKPFTERYAANPNTHLVPAGLHRTSDDTVGEGEERHTSDDVTEGKDSYEMRSRRGTIWIEERDAFDESGGGEWGDSQVQAHNDRDVVENRV